MENIIRQIGFDSLKEYDKLVSNVDITDSQKMFAFEQWKKYDGSKKGLLNLKQMKF